MTAKTASLSKINKTKVKRAPVYRRKNLSAQVIRSIINSTNVKQTLAGLKIKVDYRHAMRIRADARAKKVNVCDLTRLRNRCICEAIRQVLNQNQKKLAHLVRAPHVKQFYADAIKNNKQFAPLKKQRTPCDQIFRDFIRLRADSTPEGKLKFNKVMMTNTGNMSAEQSSKYERNKFGQGW